MSPSSAGHQPNNNSSSNPIEIERYIGSYLISTARSKNVQKTKNNNFLRCDNNKLKINDNRFVANNTGHEGWAGGMPLLSMANSNYHSNNLRKSGTLTPLQTTGGSRNHHQQTNLSRLAVHTHGFPLILAGRHNNRKNHQKHYPVTSTPDLRYHYPNHPHQNQQIQHLPQQNPAHCDPTSYNNALTVQCSKANNSATVLSDNFKDPNCAVAVDTLSVASDESSGSTNFENCLPRIIKPRKRRKKDRKPQTPPQVSPNELPPANTTEQKVVVHSGDTTSDVPNLNHDFDDVKEVQQNHCSPTSCQCKLCDPCGQIWNIDSTFLTKNNVQSIFSYQSSLDVSTPPPTEDVDRIVSALRRSWSDPVSSFSHANSNVGVIGSGRRNSSGGEATPRDEQGGKSNENLSRQLLPKLDISTEIVTSPNGQRDIEIKFLSFINNNNSSGNDLKGFQNKSISNQYDLFESYSKSLLTTYDAVDSDLNVYDTIEFNRLLFNIEE